MQEKSETLRDIIAELVGVEFPVYRGEWSVTKTYECGDVVSINGKMCRIDPVTLKPVPLPDITYNPEWAKQAEQMRAPKPTLEHLAQAVIDAQDEYNALCKRASTDFAGNDRIRYVIARQRAVVSVTRAEAALADAVRAESK